MIYAQPVNRATEHAPNIPRVETELDTTLYFKGD
jgi:hypothetical protein